MKTYKVDITVYGIPEDEYDDTIDSIVMVIEGMQLTIVIGVGEEDEE